MFIQPIARVLISFSREMKKVARRANPNFFPTETYPEALARAKPLGAAGKPKDLIEIIGNHRENSQQKLFLALLFFGCFALAKDYENFDLPDTATHVTVPDSKLAYSSPRVNFRASKVNLKTPSVKLQDYLVEKEKFLSEKRDESIRLLRQELDAGYKANRENMLLRLGQLYAEKYTELSVVENEVFGLQLEKYEKSPTKEKSKRPSLDNSRSKRYLKDALKLFSHLEKEFPKHPKLDEVIYFIGFVEMESGNTTKGLKYLERVVRTYPKSRKFDEAVLHLGDYYFEKVKFKEASDTFRILLGRKESPLRAYALYKLAWCQLNTGKPSSGLHDLKKLVSELKGNSEKSKFNLREQALKDMVLFFAEVDAVDEAMAFYTSEQGKEKALENLKLMADILRTKARDQAAMKAYQKLIAEFGDMADGPALYSGLYEIQSRLGQTGKAVETLLKALAQFGEGSEWANSLSDEKKKEGHAGIEVLSEEAMKAALFYHHSAQKSSNRASYDYALNLYRAIHKAFPNHPDSKKNRFYSAEILYEQGKWLEAANEYVEAAKISPKDKLSEESAYNALLSVDRLTVGKDTLPKITAEAKGNLPTATEIPANDKRFIEMAEFYLSEYPKSEKAVDIRFRIAAILYRCNRFDEAVEKFKQIALDNPKHRSATTAAHIVLDIFNSKKDLDGIAETVPIFLAKKELGDSGFRSELSQIISEIGFKRIEPLEREAKFEEAADGYLKFYQANPNSPLAEKALYNAYVTLISAKNSVKANETALLFITKFPKSDKTETLVLEQAKMAEKQFNFEQALDRYQKFYKKYPKNKEAEKALYNAALFSELLEKNSQAITLYEEYLKEASPSDKERKAIAISEAKLYRKLGNWPKVITIYKKLAKETRSHEERMNYLGELAHQLGRASKTTEKKELLKELYAARKKGVKLTGVAAELVAEASLQEIEKPRAQYESIRLSFPAQNLLSAMKKKEKELKKIAGQYDQVVGMGVPEWGVAALEEKGEAYQNFVIQFRGISIPKSYKAEQLEEAQKGLKEIDAQVIQPLEKKAQEIFKACIDRTREYVVASSFADKCYQFLKKDADQAYATGIFPRPAYWNTRGFAEGVAKRDY